MIVGFLGTSAHKFDVSVALSTQRRTTQLVDQSHCGSLVAAPVRQALDILAPRQPAKFWISCEESPGIDVLTSPICFPSGVIAISHVWFTLREIGNRLQTALALGWKMVQHAIDQSVGVLPLASWSLLLILGTWFPSTSLMKHFFEGQPLPSGFSTEAGVWAVTALMLVTFISWTWTNLALLCLAASYLGVAARADQESGEAADRVWRQVLPRAFVVFLSCLFQEVVVGGGLIPSAERLSNGEAQQHYVRLAVISSLLCFAASYRPDFFNSVVDGVLGRLTPNAKPDMAAVTVSRLSVSTETVRAATSEREAAPNGVEWQPAAAAEVALAVSERPEFPPRIPR